MIPNVEPKCHNCPCWDRSPLAQGLYCGLKFRSFTSTQGDDKRPCFMKCCLRSKRISPLAGFKPQTLWSAVSGATARPRGRFKYIFNCTASSAGHQCNCIVSFYRSATNKLWYLFFASSMYSDFYALLLIWCFRIVLFFFLHLDKWSREGSLFSDFFFKFLPQRCK